MRYSPAPLACASSDVPRETPRTPGTVVRGNARGSESSVSPSAVAPEVSQEVRVRHAHRLNSDARPRFVVPVASHQPPASWRPGPDVYSGACHRCWRSCDAVPAGADDQGLHHEARDRRCGWLSLRETGEARLTRKRLAKVAKPAKPNCPFHRNLPDSIRQPLRPTKAHHVHAENTVQDGDGSVSATPRDVRSLVLVKSARLNCAVKAG